MENFHSSCLSLCLTFQTFWAYGVSLSNRGLPPLASGFAESEKLLPEKGKRQNSPGICQL